MQSFIFIECPKRMELAIAVSGFNWIWPFDFMFWSYFIYQSSLKEILNRINTGFIFEKRMFKQIVLTLATNYCS